MKKSFLSSSLDKSLRKFKRNGEALLKACKNANRVTTIKFVVESDNDELNELRDLAEAFPDAFAKAYYFSLDIVCNDLLAALDEAMEAHVWEWIDGSTRDIIDTRKLQESGRVEFNPTASTIEVYYDIDYAEIVHFGGVIRSPFNPDVDIVIPARPWVEAVILGNGPVPKFDFQSSFDAVFYKAFERNLGIKL